MVEATWVLLFLLVMYTNVRARTHIDTRDIFIVISSCSQGTRAWRLPYARGGAMGGDLRRKGVRVSERE